jgi:hypothetical protein
MKMKTIFKIRTGFYRRILYSAGFLSALFIISAGCTDKEKENEESNNHVLMLIVDYTTNIFEGGKELSFNKNNSTFTITYDYNPPGDFGDIKLFYSELKEMLFYGTIIWMGCGKIEYPENLLPADHFAPTFTEDYIFPTNGFETVFHEDTRDDEYTTIWSSVQNVIKAREYLSSNPSQKVKIFFYTPSVGLGNPADWKWILFLKK